MGTGFAMQTTRANASHAALINFVRQGRTEDIIQAIQAVVTTEQSHPEQLGKNTAMFVGDVIDKRRDGVVVFP
jgi:Rad3-related DNA helicase